MDICIDFDGTCVKHAYPEIGGNIGAEVVLKQLVARGDRLILFTMRSGELLKQAIEWFENHDIPLYGINEHPKQKQWTDSPKAYGHLYIDDAALGVPLIHVPPERPYVDWAMVRKLLNL